MTAPLRVFIGYDPREAVAGAVLAHSINARATCPIAVTPVNFRHFGAFYSRPRGPVDSTEFSISRFLTPHLSGYEGVSLYMDCDMLCLTDVAELRDRALAEPGDWAAMVAKHDYVPRTARKMDDREQTTYPRKNWSSLVLFNNAACRALSPEYVAAASGLELHRFLWTADDRVRDLPLEYNWLVGEYEPNPRAKILHYTLGGPWFPAYTDCDHAKDWLAERDSLLGEAPPCLA